jgi:hypothetical protein
MSKKSPNSKDFTEEIKKYLHPEATEFYNKVGENVKYLASIQDQINDPQLRFNNGLGGLGYQFYAFEHHIFYKKWKEDINKIYKKVSNYEDLLTTNILFMKGLIPMTFYHLSPIYDINTIKLQEITKKFKYFTLEGQSSNCNDSEKQKNYLTGIIHNNNLFDLINKIEKQGEYYYGYYNIADKKTTTTLPFKTMTIKEWRELIPRDEDDEDEDMEDDIMEFYNLTLEYNPESDAIEIPFTNSWPDSLSTIWSNFKELSSGILPKKIIKYIEKNCSVLEIYGKEYCIGDIENSLYNFIK